MDEILLFANAIAGAGRGGKIAAAIQSTLRNSGYRVQMFLEPPSLVSVDPGASAAVIVGGDGTLRAVVERLFQTLPPAEVPPVLIVPLGTANLMGQHLGIKWTGGWTGKVAIQQMLVALKRRRVVKLDAAKANDQLFLLMAGVGMDGHIVHELSRVRVGPIDLTSYILPTAIALQKYNYPPISVEVDGRHIFGPRPGMAFVANIAEYGTGFPIIPHAKSDDGLLDIAVLPCRSRADAINLLLKAAAGELFDAEGVVIVRGVNVRVDSEMAIPVQVDGEAAGFTPLRVELLPFKVPFIVTS